MRIGVISLGTAVSSGGTIGGATIPPGAPDITGTITTGGAGSAPPRMTSGPSATGDTIVCPPGYPYDPAIQDCLGYVGSPADVARQILQADIDACVSGGGTWIDGQCIAQVSQIPGTKQLIAGIDNTVLYAAGGILLLMILMGARRR